MTFLGVTFNFDRCCQRAPKEDEDADAARKARQLGRVPGEMDSMERKVSRSPSFERALHLEATSRDRSRSDLPLAPTDAARFASSSATVAEKSLLIQGAMRRAGLTTAESMLDDLQRCVIIYQDLDHWMEHLIVPHILKDILHQGTDEPRIINEFKFRCSTQFRVIEMSDALGSVLGMDLKRWRVGLEELTEEQSITESETGEQEDYKDAFTADHTHRGLDLDVYDWASSVHPSDRDRVVLRWVHARLLGHYFVDKFRVVTAGGGEARVFMHATPKRDESGAVVGYLGGAVTLTPGAYNDIPVSDV